jgi:hypothetical protein
LRLFAKVSEPGLLLKSLNEAGVAFYRKLEGGRVEAVYFSASRTIYFLGGMEPGELEALRAQAYQARSFRVNEARGEVEVSQLEG